MPALPVLDALPALRRALSGAGAAVLSAPPGSGKTTLVPLLLRDEDWLAGQRILLLTPRRVAARAAAARMASLLGERVGETVGYQIRFERRIGPATRIEVITEGLLARRLQQDPELPGVGLVIFDEFHERSLDADLGLALTLDARAQLRPGLRVLVMSATLDSARVAALLGDAPVVESGGRLYEVELRYCPPRPQTPPEDALAEVIHRALAETAGDILAFLPGGREIRAVQARLESRLGTQARVHPLYGELSSQLQDAALAPARDGLRKIILATNIAQTSLTVEGVTTVVDSGLVRVARFDLGSGANVLRTERVSRASADQRAGRAGRLGPGVCYRLWSREQHGLLPAHDTPEILAADLSRLALELVQWGVDDPRRLALLDPPPEVAWRYATGLLRELGALDGQGRISAHGRQMAALPATPRRAHMLLCAHERGLGTLAAWVAAVLEEREPASLDLEQTVARYLEQRAEPGAQRRVREAARQMARLLGAPDTPPSAPERDVARLVSWAYPERLARRREGMPGLFLCADGGEARVPEREPLALAEWIAIAHWDPGPPRRVRAAAAYDEADLLTDHAPRVEARELIAWDSRQQAVTAEQQRCLGALVIERRTLRGADEPVAFALLQGIREMGLDCLPWTPAAREWQARVLSLRAWRPDEDWPEVDDAQLLARLEQWLLPALDGLSRREHLARLDLAGLLHAQLDPARQRALQRLAPTHLSVPTGSQIRLEYRPPGPPVLAVKLQELFGCAATPTVNDGRTPVLLHLLSPAQRPVAVTQDLAGFWARGYAEVRKDLRGRYPRHPWPDDPLAAPPTRRAKPRGT
ncbi:MAG: ATP-dependent helicase HrpB [Gammaproteobacteria bacterium]